MAARLARATGDKDGSLVQWANKIWDWTEEVGFINDEYAVYDGANPELDCSTPSRVQWTHASGLHILGAAVMANHTGDAKWTERATKLIDHASEVFFRASSKEGGIDPGDILTETACEAGLMCTHNMNAMKGLLALAMWRAAQMVPALDAKVRPLLTASAKAAAAKCTAGKNQDRCQSYWAMDSLSMVGPGEQLSVLNVVQGLLIAEADAPYAEGQITEVTDPNGSSKPGSGGSGGSDNEDESGAVGKRMSVAVVMGSLMVAVFGLL